MATPSCKQSEFVMGGRRWLEMGGSRYCLANQQYWHTFNASVLLLGFCPREMSSYVIKETCTSIFPDGHITCLAKKSILSKFLYIIWDTCRFILLHIDNFFPSTICWKAHSFPPFNCLGILVKSIDCKYRDLFLDSQLYSIDLYFHLCQVPHNL